MTAFKPAVGPEPSESPLQLIVSLQKIRQSLVFLFWQMLDMSVVQVDSDPGNLFLIQTDSDRLQIIDGSRDGHFEFPLVGVNDLFPGILFCPSLRLLPSLCLRSGVHAIFSARPSPTHKNEIISLLPGQGEKMICLGLVLSSV